jgi:hypothetical protein
MRGDSYQLQGQGGGVVINDGETATGKFRSLLVLSTGIVAVTSLNIVDNTNTPISVQLNTISAGEVINGVFSEVFIEGVGSQAICYYE